MKVLERWGMSTDDDSQEVDSDSAMTDNSDCVIRERKHATNKTNMADTVENFQSKGDGVEVCGTEFKKTLGSSQETDEEGVLKLNEIVGLKMSDNGEIQVKEERDVRDCGVDVGGAGDTGGNSKTVMVVMATDDGQKLLETQHSQGENLTDRCILVPVVCNYLYLD